MDLSGAFSNPRVTDEGLRTLSTLCHRLLSRGRASPKTPKAPKTRSGEVARTIDPVLSEEGRAMRGNEIQRAAEQRLGHPLSSSPLRDSLSEHSKGPKSRYLRVGY